MILGGGLIFAITLLYRRYKDSIKQRLQIKKDVAQWQDILNSYREMYLKASSFSYPLLKGEKAQSYIDTIKKLTQRMYEYIDIIDQKVRSIKDFDTASILTDNFVAELSDSSNIETLKSLSEKCKKDFEKILQFTDILYKMSKVGLPTSELSMASYEVLKETLRSKYGSASLIAHHPLSEIGLYDRLSDLMKADTALYVEEIEKIKINIKSIEDRINQSITLQEKASLLSDQCQSGRYSGARVKEDALYLSFLIAGGNMITDINNIFQIFCN